MTADNRPVLRFTRGALIADDAMRARVANLLRVVAEWQDYDTSLALTSIVEQVECGVLAPPGTWSGVNLSIDPGETQVDTSDEMALSLYREAVENGRSRVGTDGRVVEIDVRVVMQPAGGAR